MLNEEEQKNLVSILKKLEIVHEDDINSIVESMADDSNDDDNLTEALKRHDLELIDAIIKRFEKLIKGGLLLSFVAMRQQIKSLQKELADHRKKVDGEIKDQVQFRNHVNKTLKRILDTVDASARREPSPRPQRARLNRK